MLEPLWGNEVTDFFMYLPDYAFQESLVPFAMPTKKTYHAWI
jgi:hypothetical protein